MVENVLLRIFDLGGIGGLDWRVAMPNLAFKTDGLDKFIRWQLLPTPTNMSNLEKPQFNGLLQLTLFCRNGYDTDLIDEKADSIIRHFGIQKSHHLKNEGDFDYEIPEFENVFIVTSSKANGMPDDTGKWYMQPVIIEYEIS